uniref:Large ribosomal subunit protein uL24c n=1 Tax=Platysiphonia delicata TaxID=2006979 RepID=A0A1Z1M0K8_9FLOR|nr:ribosomal protein L24 [Platysiphonia delicata]ARW59638.1 ribosomal protein L24 [Platysiphonia delicata]
MKKKKSSKSFKIKFNIGDNIKIIAGKYRLRTGIIKKILFKENKVFIENINLKTKHVKPKNNEEKGTTKQIEGYIHASNIKKNI